MFVKPGIRKVVRAAGFGGGAGGEEGGRDFFARGEGVLGELESAGGNGGNILPSFDGRRWLGKVLGVSLEGQISLKLVGEDLQGQVVEAG